VYVLAFWSRTHIDIVIELYPSRAVQLYFLERLPYDVIRLAFGVLDSSYGGGFVQVAFVVDIQLAKGILKREDVGLLELRVFSLEFNDVHGEGRVGETDSEMEGERKCGLAQSLKLPAKNVYRRLWPGVHAFLGADVEQTRLHKEWRDRPFVIL
jgi:hypothetical protein